jgi:hypothetical protein
MRDYLNAKLISMYTWLWCIENQMQELVRKMDKS